MEVAKEVDEDQPDIKGRLQPQQGVRYLCGYYGVGIDIMGEDELCICGLKLSSKAGGC